MSNRTSTPLGGPIMCLCPGCQVAFELHQTSPSLVSNPSRHELMSVSQFSSLAARIFMPNELTGLRHAERRLSGSRVSAHSYERYSLKPLVSRVLQLLPHKWKIIGRSESREVKARSSQPSSRRPMRRSCQRSTCRRALLVLSNPFQAPHFYN